MNCVMKTSLKFEISSTNCVDISFLPRQILKVVDMLRQNSGDLPTVEANFENRALFNNQNSLITAADSSILPVGKGFESKYVTLP